MAKFSCQFYQILEVGLLATRLAVKVSFRIFRTHAALPATNGFDSRVRFPGTPWDFSEGVGSGTGSTQPRDRIN
jgi:hypothetical protein